MNSFNKNWIQKSMILLFVSLFQVGIAISAPYHGTPHQFSQPDGSQITLYLYGDEYYMRAETSDGFTVIRDESTGWICYAILSEDKTKLVSTGIPYKGESQNNLRVSDINIEKNIDIDAVARQNIAKANRLKLEGINEVPSSHNNERLLKISSTSAQNLPNLNIPKTKERVLGLTILIDFSDAPATISRSEINSFLNGDNYSGYGNNGSLKEYYQEISGGLLVYENVVFGYFRAPKTFAEYDTMDYLKGIKEILPLALKWVDDKGFDFKNLSAPSGVVLAVNIIHTGIPKAWNQGMWHHQGRINYKVDDVTVVNYNTSPANAPLVMGTICHENGHMIGQWPDTYKYDGSLNGIEYFDLMSSWGVTTNPVPPNPQFLYTRGWANIIDVTNSNVMIKDSSNTNTIYKYTKSESEYYLIKARQKKGRSSSIQDQGLTIWHIDRYGSNQTDQPEVLLKHADNLISNMEGVCWKKGGNETFNDFTIPDSRWYDSTTSGLKIWNIGTPGDVMTYNIGENDFVKDCNSDLGGLASKDNCGICSGGNTGIIPNSHCSSYCTSTGNYHTGGDFIVSVKIGDDIHSSFRESYADFTNLSHSFAPCEKIKINVKLLTSTPKDFCYAWIDWNKNNVFEKNEQTTFPAFISDSTFAEISVPPHLEGKFTLRIRNIYYQLLNGGGDPCGNYPGEVEDYTIEITKSCNDCNGELGGTAFIDKCNVCVGGNTGKNACIVSAIEDVLNAENKLYPSPTETNITLELSESSIEGNISIFNTFGEEMLKIKNTQENIIILPIEMLKSGLYFVRIESQNKIETLKFIKK